MANIRTRVYTKKDGSQVKKFELTYVDVNKKRCARLFKTKRDADNWRIQIENEVRNRTHVSYRDSRKVIEGMRAWLSYMEELQRIGKRERSTVAKYISHVEFHIAKSDLAFATLSELSAPDIQRFIEYLEKKLSTAMAVKVFQTLKTGFKYCRKNGWLNFIPTEDFHIEQRGRESSGKVEIPPKTEIKAVLKAADADITGIDGAMVRALCFCGLRPSEMRGLPRTHVSFDTNPPYLEVGQRADVYGKIGNPKSRAGYRKIPMGPETVRAFKHAMLARKAGRYNLVLPNPHGGVMSYYNFIHRRWPAIMKRAGLVTIEMTKCKSTPEKTVKKIRTKFHPYALRHVAASNWIEMGLMPKRIQELMGHSSLKMTMDIYGHLWANPEVDKVIANTTELAFA